jgi:hypothetical protein
VEAIGIAAGITMTAASVARFIVSYPIWKSPRALREGDVGDGDGAKLAIAR